jgi:DNA-binding PadR family transcriptional regulator
MNDAYIDRLVQDWETIYKKGLLTFWILLALYDGDKRMDDIKIFIEAATNQQFSVDDKSMYRALRRYYDAEFVDFTLQKNSAGPDWKVYSLSTLGSKVLGQFAKRNIQSVMYKTEVRTLIERCAI